MEFLLNLLWLLVCCALVVLWTMRGSEPAGASARRRGSKPIVFSERRTQIIALCLLIILLFPVISLTDDLVAWQAAAETEHTQRLDAVHTFLQQTIAGAALPGWMHGLLLPQLSAARMHALLTHDRKQVPLKGVAPSVENRPPPVLPNLA
jgi:hypothetical protein